MAKMTAWAHFHECKEPADLASLSAAFAEATEAAEAAGCEVSLAGEDAGDREVEAVGRPEAVAGAAFEFQERGFDPQVEVSNHHDRVKLYGLLPNGVPLDLKPPGPGGEAGEGKG